MLVRDDRSEVRHVWSGGGLRPGFPARRQCPRHPQAVELRPGTVGNDGVEPGVQRIDQWLVVLGDRIGHEIAWAESVRDNHRRVVSSDYGGSQSSGRYPRVELAG